jgi:parvulin-like peptidyl-prolyl isomerase
MSLCAILLAGCASKGSAPHPLASTAFYPGGVPAAANTPSPDDQNSELIRSQPTGGIDFPKPNPVAPPPPPTVTPVNPAATQPSATQSSVSATKPQTPLAIGASSGKYQLLGSVVADVNSTPIYANNVLTSLNRMLAQKAREQAPEQFREFAAKQIQERVQELIDDEVWLAAAKRNLSEDDQKRAEQVTLMWRTDQITQSGGSLEIARARVAAEGDDLDEMCRQQYRKNIVELFKYKKITPRIQVTIDDMRRYYDKHKEDEFTEHAAVRFRLLEVSVERTGSRTAALAKMRLKYDRAIHGEDFKAICTSENDDSSLSTVGGDLGWKQKGSFPPSMEKVDTAVWALKLGQFSDIIDNGDAFYLAQVIEVRQGRVRSFNEAPEGNVASVQDDIRRKLQNLQFRAIAAEIDQNLRKDAIFTWDPQKLELCLDMAMQRYAVWRNAGLTSKAE